MKKIIFGIGLITILSKIFGFFREISLSYFFGANQITDAFLISNTVPNVIFSFIASGLVYSFIPIYNEIKKAHGTNRANSFTITLLNILIILASLVCIFIFAFTQDVVKMLAAGFEGETLQMAIKFTRISMFGVYGLIFISIIEGILKINNKFYFLALIGFPYNIIYISGIYISYKFTYDYLPITNLIAILSQLLLLLYPFFKTDFKVRFSFNLHDIYLKKLFFLAVPIIINSGVASINLVVDRTLASTLMIGGVTILTYAWLVRSAIYGLLVTPIVTVFFPKISHCITDEDFSTLSRHINNIFTLSLVLMVPMTFGIMLYSHELVDFILNRGKFTTENAYTTSLVLRYYTISFFSGILGTLMADIYYALKKTKIILYNSIIGIILNITLNLILSRYMGIYGLALATSISGITTMLLLAKSINKYEFFNGKYILVVFAKATIAALIMAIGVMVFKEFISFNYSLINIFVGALFGFILYTLMLFFMKIELVNYHLIDLIRKLKSISLRSKGNK